LTGGVAAAEVLSPCRAVIGKDDNAILIEKWTESRRIKEWKRSPALLHQDAVEDGYRG
jgi:hypothetical protein